MSSSRDPICKSPGCGHLRSLHGDRAVHPACEGGFDGHVRPSVDQRWLYPKACGCMGYTP